MTAATVSKFGIGYRTGSGSGGTVTQATSKSTGVTLNTACGRITMNAAALAATTKVAFTLTNSLIEAVDIILINIASGNTASAYKVQVDSVAAGSCVIVLHNESLGLLSEAVVLNFAILKGAIS